MKKDTDNQNLNQNTTESEGKVLSFPRAVSDRKFLRDRINTQKLTLALSLLSVVMVCTFFNQFLLSNNGNNDVTGRGVASLHSPEDLTLQLQRLDASRDIMSAERPSRLDQFIIGELGGRVHVEMEGNRIVQLDWPQAARLSRAEAQRVITEYKDQFAIGKLNFSVDSEGRVQSLAIIKE